MLRLEVRIMHRPDEVIRCFESSFYESFIPSG
jgi:hypothetical protein